MRLLYKISTAFLLLCTWHLQDSYAQERKASKVSYQNRPPAKKTETPATPPPTPATDEETFKPKKPSVDLEGITTKKIDTVIVIKRPKTVVKDNLVSAQDSGYCKCVQMSIKAPDTLRFGDYINYSFIFKNKCKETVHISSSSFKIQPFNFFGHKVKVLREVSFVKRFDVPEFVILGPKDSFEYRFADDPFFEFDLRKAEQYKFQFYHSNKSTKSKNDPSKTYLCTEAREKMIFVK